ncbi:MAG: DUF401 family protein, partial [Nitrospirota bacterium]
MFDLLKLFLVFALILLLLRKKLNIGLVMLIAASLLFVLYQMPFTSIGKTCKEAALNSVTIKLILALSFIRIFELILREHAVLTQMMSTVKSIFKNSKIVAISMPLLIGLLPSVGGAYFSAPMVAEATRDTKMMPEEKGFINYWFRHPWEYILPLYPGILLASAISKVELHNLIVVNFTYAVLILLTGFIFGMRGVKGVKKAEAEEPLSKRGLWSFLPIILVLMLVVIFHIELHIALIVVVISLLVFYRYNPRSVLSALKRGFSLEVIILIVGIMLFKETMENSGAVRNLSQF